jgi:hypothetical protein
MAPWIDMTTNAQTLPVETWDAEPKLEVVGKNGHKAATNGSRTKMAAPTAFLRETRPELEVLGWEARVGRLVNLSRNCR